MPALVLDPLEAWLAANASWRYTEMRWGHTDARPHDGGGAGQFKGPEYVAWPYRGYDLTIVSSWNAGFSVLILRAGATVPAIPAPPAWPPRVGWTLHTTTKTFAPGVATLDAREAYELQHELANEVEVTREFCECLVDELLDAKR